MSDTTLDEDDAKEIQSDLEESDEDVKLWQRVSAGVQLTLLFTGIFGSLVGAVVFGYIDPYIEVIAEVNIGWIIEYLIIGLVAAFLLYVFTLILIWLPGSIISAVAGLAYGVAKQQGLIEDNE